MSIYGRRKGLTGYETIQGEPFMGTAPVDMRPPLDDSRDWSHLRKARPVEVLLPMGERWLRSLPPNVRPQALEAQFPRIVNLIALQWDDRKRCPDYFLELTTDRRGGRRGFPPAVGRELSVLLDYWYAREPLS